MAYLLVNYTHTYIHYIDYICLYVYLCMKISVSFLIVIKRINSEVICHMGLGLNPFTF